MKCYDLEKNDLLFFSLSLKILHFAIGYFVEKTPQPSVPAGGTGTHWHEKELHTLRPVYCTDDRRFASKQGCFLLLLLLSTLLSLTDRYG